MNRHTQAERAASEHLHQLLELVLKELDRKAFPFAYMQDIDRKGKAFIEHAARRAPAAPVLLGWKITEEQHVAAVKVLHSATGVDGLPQRMLDAMIAAAKEIGATHGQ